MVLRALHSRWLRGVGANFPSPFPQCRLSYSILAFSPRHRTLTYPYTLVPLSEIANPATSTRTFCQYSMVGCAAVHERTPVEV